MTTSKIEWTEITWNPLTGCTKISPGCLNCYAEKMALRLKSMGVKNYKNGFDLTLHEHMLDVPFKLGKPKIIFVNSMSDLFHEDVPFEFIQKIFHVMNQNKQHIFQVLTKRSRRMLEFSNKINFTQNIWLGVSVENSDYTYRVDNLLQTNASLKFVSFEPLIGPIDNFNTGGIDWVIVGGESGPKARLMQKDWVNSLKCQSIKNNIPFFFKQWGGINKKKSGRLLDGKTWDQMPHYRHNIDSI